MAEPVYLTLDEAKKRLKGKVDAIYWDDDLTPEAGVNDDLIKADITAAESEIDGYVCQAGYKIPVTNEDEQMRRLTLMLFLENAYANRLDIETPEDVKDGAKIAREWLMNLVKGINRLCNAPAKSEGSAAPANIHLKSNTPVWQQTSDQAQGFF
jgi:hypothetical protein